jgi:ribosomal protein S18 acetylase RimI-like enzyme
MLWLLLLIIIICIAIIFKIHIDKYNLQKTAGEYFENLFYKQKWLYLTMEEVKLLPDKLLNKINTLIMRMDYNPKMFWEEMPKAKVLIIMDDDKKEPIGFLKTLKPNTCEGLFKRVQSYKSYVDTVESVYISSVFIHPDYRGKGYGNKIMEFALKLIKIDFAYYAKTNALKVILEVRKNNDPARKLYDKLSFKNIGKTKEAYLMLLET